MRSRLLQKLRIHRNDHESKNSTKTEVNDRIDLTSASSASSQAQKDSIPKPHQAASSEESTQDRSLWDQAYAALDSELVEAYERLLSEELPTNSGSSITDLNDTASKNLDETANNISKQPKVRQGQLEEIGELGRQRMERNAITYKIAGRTFDLRDQIANAARLIQWAKSIIDEAVKASPEASMAWCGICLALPLLTLPSETAQKHRDGLTYVTGRMQFYVSLEPLLFPKNLDTNAEDLRCQFKSSIVQLYRHILEYQLNSVLWFFRTRLGRFRRTLTNQDSWSVSAIQELESDIKDKFKEINDSSIRQELEKLSSASEKSAQTMCDLLSVANEQLLISRELLKLEKYANFPIEAAALYDSSEHQNEYSLVCQEGTRKRVLEEITQWANAVNGETIFWLHGPAGNGKSTISRTIARDLASTKQLGASYFFKRQGRSASKFFFPTIINSLVHSIPQLETYVCESLDKELGTLTRAGIETKSLEVQFKTLILNPVSNLPEQYSDTRPRIIVVDALDECENSTEIEKICSLLVRLQELHKVRLTRAGHQ